MTSSKFADFWGRSAQTLRPNQNSRRKGTSLWRWLAPKIIPSPEIVAFELYAQYNHPTLKNLEIAFLPAELRAQNLEILVL